MDWSEKISEWLDGPCTHCGDEVSSPATMDHVAMPVTRPSYVDPYLESLAGPNEPHEIDPNGHCINPKCRYLFTPQDEEEIRQNNGEFTCPNCHMTYDYFAGQKNPTFMRDLDYEGQTAWDATKTRPANPGGMTRSGLSLDQMGEIGEQVVERMHELPGIGTIVEVSHDKHFPIDMVVQSQRGNFGCEIKTNHSQAQERFKVGGKEERQAKIRYCLENGLKPALIGVRLNFYTDKAYIFFREGLTDTWIGNKQMVHVATLDFSDLNPFKSPDPQAQALAVENAHLPDQASENTDSDLDELFGWGNTSDNPEMAYTALKHEKEDTSENHHTFQQDIHELKVRDKKGKHTHTIKRCPHCGVLYQKPVEHRGRFECPTCDQDPDAEPPRLAKVVLAGPKVDDLAKSFGFEFGGRTGRGERIYRWTDPTGFTHVRTIGSGAHGSHATDIDLQRARQRFTRCTTNNCNHPTSWVLQPNITAEVGAPVFRQGQTIAVDGREFFVTEIVPETGQSGIALVQDLATGAEDVLPVQQNEQGEWTQVAASASKKRD